MDVDHLGSTLAASGCAIRESIIRGQMPVDKAIFPQVDRSLFFNRWGAELQAMQSPERDEGGAYKKNPEADG